MRKFALLSAVIVLFGASVAHATDVANKDSKPYKIKVQGEGKLSISYHQIKAGGTMYGLCGYSFCTFEIPGSKVSAKKDDKLVIQGGKFK
jgi:hypothetical protein